MSILRVITTAAAAAAVALGAVGCTGTGADVTALSTSDAASAAAVVDISSPSAPLSSAVATGQGTPEGSAGTTGAALETLPVKGRAPKTGYDRERFGQRWTDTDRNGCDTRIICIHPSDLEESMAA